MPLSESATLNSSQDIVVSGNGSAGTPDTGVVSVQGVSGGTAVPVSLPTVSTAANQATEIASLASIQSTSNSTAVNSAAIQANQTNGSQRTLVTDLVGNLQPSGDAPSRAIVTKISDGTNTASIASNELFSRDILNVSGQNRAQSVTTTAAEALGATTILANRKMLSIRPTNGIVYWGFTSGVTTATGTPIYTNEVFTISASTSVHIFVISAATVDARMSEAS